MPRLAENVALCNPPDESCLFRLARQAFNAAPGISDEISAQTGETHIASAAGSAGRSLARTGAVAGVASRRRDMGGAVVVGRGGLWTVALVDEKH
jgi:hypothetical protein